MQSTVERGNAVHFGFKHVRNPYACIRVLSYTPEKCHVPRPEHDRTTRLGR